MINTAQAILTIYPSASPIDDFRVDIRNGVETIRWINVAPLTKQQIDNAKAAVSDSQYAVARAALQHPALVSALSGNDFEVKLLRALLLILLDEFNLHSTFEAAVLSATASATSLADLKTRFAAITPVPQRTKANLITAMTNQINAGSADS